MIYAISDLHGYPLDRLKMLLDKAGFCDKDFLFIIGDVIDRNGDGGVSILSWLILQKWLAVLRRWPIICQLFTSVRRTVSRPFSLLWQ